MQTLPQPMDYGLPENVEEAYEEEKKNYIQNSKQIYREKKKKHIPLCFLLTLSLV